MEFDAKTTSVVLGFLIGVIATDIVAKIIANKKNKEYLYSKIKEECRCEDLPYSPDDYQFKFI